MKEEAEGDSSSHDGNIEEIGPLRQRKALLGGLPRGDEEGPKEGNEAKGIDHHGPRAITLYAPFPVKGVEGVKEGGDKATGQSHRIQLQELGIVPSHHEKTPPKGQSQGDNLDSGQRLSLKGDGEDGDEDGARVLKKNGGGDIRFGERGEIHEIDHAHPTDTKGRHEKEVLFREFDELLLEDSQCGEKNEKGEGRPDLNQHGGRNAVAKEVLRHHAVYSPHGCGQDDEEIALPLV